MSNLNYLSIVAMGAALTASPILQARPCSGNGDVSGAYGWTASRSPLFVPAPGSPQATTTTIVRSGTALGALAGGAANTQAFAAVGRTYLDREGGIFASASATTQLLQVGTYSINVDCTVSMTITDAFMPAQFFFPTQASATFQGVVVQTGSEINLAQTSGIGGTTLSFKKMRQFGGCAEDVLNGSFGLVMTGISYVVEADGYSSATPFTFAGRFTGDGTGAFVTDSLAQQSPLSARQFTGFYSVNSDCTGIGTLVDGSGKIRKTNFVVINPSVGLGGDQGILFAFTDSNVGAGVAVQQ